MRYCFLLLLCISVLSCVQEKSLVLGDTDWQKEMNADFKDATKSPLKDTDRKSFKSLEFFKFDSIYVVTATLKRTPDAKPFKMKTTTSRLPTYVQYAVVSFTLNDKEHNLSIYQNVDFEDKEGYEDYLFLPFLDETNGDGSYGGGRYVEARIPDGNTLVLDFNKAYNPYCAYNEKYSCPIVPRANFIEAEVRAGVKVFSKY